MARHNLFITIDHARQPLDGKGGGGWGGKKKGSVFVLEKQAYHDANTV